MILIREIDGDRRTVTIELAGPPSAADTQARQRIDDLASTVGFDVLQSSPGATSGANGGSVTLEPGFDFRCFVRGGCTRYHLQCPRDIRLLKRLNALLGAIIATSELGNRHTSFNVAIYELLANCIEHGCSNGAVADGEDTLRVRMTIGARRITGIVADRCDRFDPFTPENTERARTSTREMGPRGYGLRLVGQILDDFRYRRTRDSNIFLFAKDLKT